mmetsp:Transcript_15173/g.28992  ORF Transcript_15173/g.28992 Transcript_15173/m.28992 type:complete len:146 (+) Transcript_15173:681-1118(+)|eukprot:scaffold17301_cov115-Amphora_coffeaeformis.AAC.2
MGNIPLAAVLYGNGVSFAGIMAFIFSDLVVFPILRINAKFYGWEMALYILSIFLACLVATSLILHYIFDPIGILPSSDDVQDVSERDFFELNYHTRSVSLSVSRLCQSFAFVTTFTRVVFPAFPRKVRDLLKRCYSGWHGYTISG